MMYKARWSGVKDDDDDICIAKDDEEICGKAAFDNTDEMTCVETEDADGKSRWVCVENAWPMEA